MPAVTVIIVNWNTRERLRECLRALSGPAAPADAEVVVVDNGSDDGSPVMVRDEFPAVRLLRHASNDGFAKAVNRGLRETASPFVLLLNSDARPEPGAIDALARHLRDHPDAAAAGAQLLKPGGDRQHSFDAFPSLATELLNKAVLRRLFPGRYPSRLQARSEPLEVDSLIGACLLLRRAAVEAVGGLDERFFVFFEETDWCLRARRAGWRIVFVPTARAVHAQGGTKARHPGRGRVEYWRAKYAYFDKHRGRGVRALLQAAATARLTLQVACRLAAWAATLGVAVGPRARLAADAWLWLWHMLGAPRAMGFAPPGPCPGFLRLADDRGVRWVPRERALALQSSPLARLDAYLDSPAATLRKEGRTKRHYAVTLASDGAHREWYVKVYRARGAWGRFKDSFAGDKAFRELGRACEAARRGVRTNLPEMAGRWGAGPRAGESWLVYRPLEGWTNLDAWLRESGGKRAEASGDATSEQRPAESLRARRRTVRAFGRFAREVYDGGVDQDDFNPTNAFFRQDAAGAVEFLLVDFERVRIRPVVPESRRLRTMAKMGRVPEWATRTDRFRFVREVLPPGTSKAERRAFGRKLAEAWTRLRGGRAS